MCNLYSLTRNVEAIRQLFRIPHNRTAAFEPLQSVFPGYAAPVVRRAPDGERELALLNWGFVLLRDGYAPKRVTNTRDDKAKSGFWRQSIEQRRCLVPASSFCEPHDGTKPVQWAWFGLNGDEPRPLFAFAGVWRKWSGPIKKDGQTVEQDVFSFMTTEPNALTASINHERSPVLLTEQAHCDQWMHGSFDEAMALVKPIEPERIRIIKEGLDKKDDGTDVS